jgi:hypothetical protein
VCISATRRREKCCCAVEFVGLRVRDVAGMEDERGRGIGSRLDRLLGVPSTSVRVLVETDVRVADLDKQRRRPRRDLPVGGRRTGSMGAATPRSGRRACRRRQRPGI